MLPLITIEAVQLHVGRCVPKNILIGCIMLVQYVLLYAVPVVAGVVGVVAVVAVLLSVLAIIVILLVLKR